MSARSAGERWLFASQLVCYCCTHPARMQTRTGQNKAANFPQNHEEVKEYRGREGEKESVMITATVRGKRLKTGTKFKGAQV